MGRECGVPLAILAGARGNALVGGLMLDTSVLLHLRELGTALVGDTKLPGVLADETAVVVRNAFSVVLLPFEVLCHAFLLPRLDVAALVALMHLARGAKRSHTMGLDPS